MVSEVNFSIANDFSRFTGGRLKKDGPFSGEELRDDFLIKLILAYDVVTIDFSGTTGYGSSFLEEAFGGLVRENVLPKSELLKKLHLVASNAEYKRYAERALSYIEAA